MFISYKGETVVEKNMEKLRAIHKEQTASRRSQPSSRIASKRELKYPINLLIRIQMTYYLELLEIF